MARINAKYLAELNDPQYEAATAEDSTILCLAGAGTGKTRTLTSRIAFQFDENRVGLGSQLALTFTRLAGKEMKERVIGLVGEREGKKLFANTFHAFAVRVLQDYGQRIGLDAGFSIYDEIDRAGILEAIIPEFGKRTTLSKVMKVFDKFGPGLEDEHPEEYRVINEYKFRLRKNNAVDLDQLVPTVVSLFESHEDARLFYHRTFTHVYVDEFQDTSPDQMRLVELLDPRFLFVVGDDYQAIYGWRGACVDFIIDFDKSRACRVVKLEDNYRSTIQIVQAANKLIGLNKRQTKKTLYAHKDGPDIVFEERDDELDEASKIGVWIKWMTDEGMAPEKIAVLARTNYQLQTIKGMLQTMGVKAQVVTRDEDTFKKPDIRGLVSWLEFIGNRRDSLSLKKLLSYPRPFLTDKEIRAIEVSAMKAGIELWDYFKMNAPTATHPGVRDFWGRLQKIDERIEKEGVVLASQALKVIFEVLELEEHYKARQLKARRDDIDFVFGTMIRWEAGKTALGEEATLSAFLKWMRIRDHHERLALQNSKAVKLMTVHASKGLEFDAVILAGMNQGIFPSRRAYDMEEERRLCYVAITRARDRLIVLRPRLMANNWNGRKDKFEESQFIKEAGII